MRVARREHALFAHAAQVAIELPVQRYREATVQRYGVEREGLLHRTHSAEVSLSRANWLSRKVQMACGREGQICVSATCLSHNCDSLSGHLAWATRRKTELRLAPTIAPGLV